MKKLIQPRDYNFCLTKPTLFGQSVRFHYESGRFEFNYTQCPLISLLTYIQKGLNCFKKWSKKEYNVKFVRWNIMKRVKCTKWNTCFQSDVVSFSTVGSNHPLASHGDRSLSVVQSHCGGGKRCKKWIPINQSSRLLL